jgi:hypothetical protein
MSTIAAAATRGGARVRTVASADVIAVAALALLSALLVALTWKTWGDIGSDTGYDLVAGSRVAHGHLPYVDFVYYYGPLGPMLLGAAAWIGGSVLSSSIAVGLVLAAAAVASTYVLGRLLAGPVPAFLAAAITAPLAFGTSNYSYVMPHSESATLAILLSLWFLIGIGFYARRGSIRWLVVSGSAAGLIALTRPEFELAIIVGGVVWLAVSRRKHVLGGRQIAALAAPALAIPLMVYGAFLFRVSFHSLVLENLYPVDTLNAGGRAILRSHAPMTVGSVASVGGKLVVYAAGCALLLVLARLLQRESRFHRIVVGGTIAFAVCVAAAAVVRPETVRYYLEYAYGWIPAGIPIVAVLLLVRAWRVDPRWDAVAQVELVGAAFLVVLAGKTYADFVLYSHVPQLAIYAAPFAALFLARLHLGPLARSPHAWVLGAAWLAALAVAGVGLSLKDAHAESMSVAGPGGSLKASPGDAVLFQAAVRWIDTQTRPSEPVLLAPQLTALYLIADRPDPLPEISLIPGALPSAQDERAAIARLGEVGLRAAITDGRSFGEYGQTTFGGSFDRVLASWIHRHFDRAGVLVGRNSAHKLTFWVRRGK